MGTAAVQTVRELVTAALRKAQIVDADETPSATDMDAGVGQLQRMLKAWQAVGGLWTRAEVVVTATTAASYVLSTRPVRVLFANFRRSGIDTPMIRMTRDQYDSLPLKTTTGIPTQFYYDRQKETGTLFVWPVLAAATGETIRLTVDREIEDVTGPNDAIDVPAEWYDAVVYGLAARLCDDYGRADGVASRVIQRAEIMLRDARAMGMDEDVFFQGDRW